MSNQTSDDNKRIAKNTLFLYLRMFVMMLTALFTSRIVLDVLGASDYGLNNIIGGCVVFFFEFSITFRYSEVFEFSFRTARL